MFDKIEETVEVIGVGMAEDNIINSQDSFIPEIRGNDALAGIEMVPGPASSVDEKRFAARQMGDGRAALSDIEENDFCLGFAVRHGEIEDG